MLPPRSTNAWLLSACLCPRKRQVSAVPLELGGLDHVPPSGALDQVLAGMLVWCLAQVALLGLTW